MAKEEHTHNTVSDAGELTVEECLAACRAERRSAEAARKTTAYTRYIAIVPAIGFFISAIVLSLGTLLGVVKASADFATHPAHVHDLAINLVECADLFLLSVVLYMLALGLISLFVTDRLPLPTWLSFHDFDDLKERLVSVIGAMMGVFFLGYVLDGATGLDVLWMGLAIAVVLAALSFFVRNVLMKGGHR
ncbi:MAG: YqhA family protein [Eggerthellaceae bacterium]|nr:YqhA family protein [Eggerthellaceae bacterium]